MNSRRNWHTKGLRAAPANAPILADRNQNRWKIDATPSFVINRPRYSGEMSYDALSKLIPEVWRSRAGGSCRAAGLPGRILQN
jgi:hypothetical protein